MRQLLGTQISIVAVAVGAAQPGHADIERQSSFDTAGYLSACTGFVGNVEFALPMDSQCVTQAVRMCNLSAEMQETQRCVEDAAAWLEADGARIASQIPGFEESMLDDAAHSGFSLLPVTAGAVPDCEELSEPDLSAEAACRYSEGLLKWHKLRFLERSNSSEGK